jgi:hypothetical protein
MVNNEWLLLLRLVDALLDMVNIDLLLLLHVSQPTQRSASAAANLLADSDEGEGIRHSPRGRLRGPPACGAS